MRIHRKAGFPGSAGQGVAPAGAEKNLTASDWLDTAFWNTKQGGDDGKTDLGY
jgi:hypothetical protein